MIRFTMDPVAVAQLVSVVFLPLLVALVTTRVTSSAVKAWLLAGLSLVSSLLAEAIRTWTEGGVYDVGVGLLITIPTFVVAVATYYGLWKPANVAQTIQARVGRTGGEHAKSAPLGTDGPPVVTEVDETPPPPGYEPRHRVED